MQDPVWTDIQGESSYQVDLRKDRGGRMEGGDEMRMRGIQVLGKVPACALAAAARLSAVEQGGGALAAHLPEIQPSWRSAREVAAAPRARKRQASASERESDEEVEGDILGRCGCRKGACGRSGAWDHCVEGEGEGRLKTTCRLELDLASQGAGRPRERRAGWREAADASAR